MKGKEITGAEIVCESLLAQGAPPIFGYPGGAVIPLYDALFAKYVGQQKLRHILVRHEQAAAFAAVGYGRATGRAGVCLATSGPGATNLVTGIADAMMDSVPVVAITGQVFSHLLGTDAFQETDAIGVMMPVCKHSFFVSKPQDIEKALAEAFFLAENGRPGPVHVDITKDAFLAKAPFQHTKITEVSGFSLPTPATKDALQQATKLIQNAKKPLAIIGHGAMISRAQAEVADFLERTGVPAVSTLHGLSTLPTSHPNLISMLGMHGSVAANYATHGADLVISLGSRFDDRITGRLNDFCPEARVLHFDIDPAEFSKNVPADACVAGDLRENLANLLPMVPSGGKARVAAWWEQIESWQREYPIDRGQRAQDHGQTMTVPDVVQILGKETGGNAFVTADVGQHQMFLAQYMPFQKFGGWQSSGGLGAMGAGLPMAMGMQVAMPTEEVWSISGDGGFQMNGPELATLMQDNIGVNVAVMNNSYLGMVRQWQELYHEKNYASTKMWNPDFLALAKAYHMPAWRATTPAEAQTAIAEARATAGPTFIEFVVAAEENVYPMVDAGASLRETRVGCGGA